MEKMKLNETTVDVAKAGLSLAAGWGVVGLTMDALGFLPRRIGLIARLTQGVASAAICGLMSENASAYMERAVDKAATAWNEIVNRIEIEDKVREDPAKEAEV